MNHLISVVLVRTIYPRNIGMAARALANMGGGQLILIAPQCELDEEARQGAAGAQGPLREAKKYRSWDEFYAQEGEGARFAFSARDGRLREAECFAERLEKLQEAQSPFLTRTELPIYLIFGPEDDGLTTEDMHLAHFICRLPTYGEFTSLNLSHAVLLTVYILQDFMSRKLPVSDVVQPVQRRGPVYFPEKTIETWLETLGFDLSARRVNAAKILNRILLENSPSHDELRVLESILQQNIRKLRELESG